MCVRGGGGGRGVGGERLKECLHVRLTVCERCEGWMKRKGMYMYKERLHV